MSKYPERFHFKFTGVTCRPDDTTVGKVYEAVRHLNGAYYYNFIDDIGNRDTCWIYTPNPAQLGPYSIEIVNDHPQEETMPNYPHSLTVVFTEDIPDTSCVVKGKEYRCVHRSKGLYEIYDGGVFLDRGWIYDTDSGTLGGYGVRVIEDDQPKTTLRTKHIDVLTAYLRNKDSCLRVEYPGGKVVEDYQCLVIPGDDCIVELITDSTQVKRCQLQSQLNSLHTEFNKEKQRLQSELAALTGVDND